MSLSFGQSLFPRRPAGIIQTFDSTDIAEGTGTEKYGLLLLDETSGTLQKIISNNIIASMISKPTSTTGATVNNRIGSPAFVSNIDLDFDLSLYNLPRTVRGSAYIKFKWAATESSGGGQTNDQTKAYTITRIRKWDGSTETTIASYQTATETITDTETHTEMHQITIPKTLFKKGEYLRVTIEIWVAIEDADHAGDDIAATLYHNPNTAGEEIFAWIPYEIIIT